MIPWRLANVRVAEDTFGGSALPRAVENTISILQCVGLGSDFFLSVMALNAEPEDGVLGYCFVDYELWFASMMGLMT